MSILSGGVVVDGTGAVPRRADVVFEDGCILDIVEPGSAHGDSIDVDGLVVAPGFVDCHTHYDAQVLWDPDLTPSSWHGVTTIVMGNCGFGIAPTTPSGRESIAQTLENVEGMSVDALMEGITWDFETFPEYLDAVAARSPRLNVAVMLGHTPLRLYVMGPAAVERAATAAEISQMRSIVLEALDAGAVGFASSRQPGHVGAWGKPVPSRLADVLELETLADALRERSRGTLAITRGPDYGPSELAQLSKATGRPVTWTALPATRGGFDPLEVMDETRRLGGDVWPQIACRPVVLQVTLADPAPFARVAAFAQALSVPATERQNFYQNADWRIAARDGMSAWPDIWERIYVQETEKHLDLAGGCSLAELARIRGVEPIDMLCDIALDDGLKTRFRMVLGNDDTEGIADLLRDPSTLLGLSDAGAHASQLCDAVFSSYVLEHWVRETQTISLEKAVWRLTGHPAQVFGLPGRGRIAPGFAADLVVFDPATIGVEPMRRVWDLPASADRLVADSRGIEKVWVNGILVRDGQTATDHRPGRVIRNGGTSM